MNTKELKVQMLRNEKTAEQLCYAIGISKSAWFRKIKGESQFTQKEIAGLKSELNLDDHLVGIIFFNDKVS